MLLLKRNKNLVYRPLYLFKIELAEVKPKVWRKFFVPSDLTLNRLHEVIMDVMGWNGIQFYNFEIEGELFCEEIVGINENNKKLIFFKFHKNSQFLYNYNSNCTWVHRLKLLNTDYKPEDIRRTFGCIGGARSCPYEDLDYVSLNETYDYDCDCEFYHDYDHDFNSAFNHEVFAWNEGIFFQEDFSVKDINYLLKAYESDCSLV